MRFASVLFGWGGGKSSKWRLKPSNIIILTAR